MIKLIAEKGTDKLWATGDTYPHRDDFRRAGWLWEPNKKAWWTRERNTEIIEKVLDLFTHIKSSSAKRLSNALDRTIEPRDVDVLKNEMKIVETKTGSELDKPVVRQMWKNILGDNMPKENDEYVTDEDGKTWYVKEGKRYTSKREYNMIKSQKNGVMNYYPNHDLPNDNSRTRGDEIMNKIKGND